jgi:hypothetical protein
MVHLYCNLLILTQTFRAARDHNRRLVLVEDDFLVTCGENGEGGQETFWLPVSYPRCMRFFSVLLAGGVLASLCLSSIAQTADSSSASSGQQQTPPHSQSSTPAAPQAPVAPLKLENLPADPHTPTPEELAAEAAERTRAQIVRLATSQANWGPPSSTPGIVLTLKETGRTKTDAGTQITYRLVGTGFTPEMRLTLLRWPLNQRVTPVMNDIMMDESGTAVCAGTALAATAKPENAASDALACGKRMQPKAPVEITTTAAKGEAVRVALISPELKRGAAVSLVPFPVMSEDKGCKLQMMLGSKDAELVLIEGDGFKPNVPFTMGSETFGVKKPMETKLDAQGHFVAAIAPYVAGHDSGDTVVFFQSDACTPTFSFHWGKDSYKAE